MVQRTRDEAKRAKYEAQLEMPRFPIEVGYLWTAFLRLRKRASGGMGPSPISWADIDAFSRHSGLRLLPWEIETIEALDDLWLAAAAT